MTTATLATAPDLLDAATAKAKARDWPGAIALAEQALALAPGDVRTALRLGEWLGFAGRLADSAAILLPLAEAAPGNAGVLRSAAGTLARLQRFDEAMELAGRAVALRPDDVENHRSLGLACLAAGRWDAALAAFQAAIARKPGDGGLVLQAARVQHAAGRLAEATRVVEEAIAIDATRPDAWRFKSQLLHEAKDQPGAATAARQAILLQPTAADGHYRLAVALLPADPAGAAAAVAAALDRAPKNRAYLELAAQVEATLANPPPAPAPAPALAPDAKPAPIDRRKAKRAARKKPAA